MTADLVAFAQSGGMTLIVSTGQILAATLAMLVYSWRLGLLVLLCFAPMFWLTPLAQRLVGTAYRDVRARVGGMLAFPADLDAIRAAVAPHVHDRRRTARS